MTPYNIDFYVHIVFTHTHLFYYVAPRDSCWLHGSRYWILPPITQFLLPWIAAELQSDKITSSGYLISPCKINCTHWYSSMLSEHLWRPNSGCEHIKVVANACEKVVHFCWCRLSHTQYADSCPSLAKITSAMVVTMWKNIVL